MPDAPRWCLSKTRPCIVSFDKVHVRMRADPVVINPGLIIHPPFSLPSDCADWLRSECCKWENASVVNIFFFNSGFIVGQTLKRLWPLFKGSAILCHLGSSTMGTSAKFNQIHSLFYYSNTQT